MLGPTSRCVANGMGMSLVQAGVGGVVLTIPYEFNHFIESYATSHTHQPPPCNIPILGLTPFSPQNLLESCLLMLNTPHHTTPPQTHPALYSESPVHFTSIPAPAMALGLVSALYLNRNWQREWGGDWGGLIAVRANTSSSECLSLGRRGRVQEGGVTKPPFHLGGMVAEAPCKRGGERTLLVPL